jgi:hypothetical protein
VFTKRLHPSDEQKDEGQDGGAVHNVDALHGFDSVLWAPYPSSKLPATIRHMPENPTLAPVPLVEVRLWLPRDVAEWYEALARGRYRRRGVYIRELLVDYYLSKIGGSVAGL